MSRQNKNFLSKNIWIENFFGIAILFLYLLNFFIHKKNPDSMKKIESGFINFLKKYYHIC